MTQSSPFSTLIVFAALTVVGLGLAPRLSVQYLPTARALRITVSYTWPDAAPALLEQEVTAPLEGVFDLVRGVRGLYSVSGSGSGYIRLDLDEDADLDYLRFEIAMRIRQVYPGLPEGVGYPQVEVNRPEEDESERPLLTWSLSGDDAPSVLYDYAREQLAPQLALTGGLQRIDVAGGNAPEWRLIYDGAQLRALGLTPADLRRALREHFRTEALGAARTGGHTYYLRLEAAGEEATPDWASIPVGKAGGRLVCLGDVAGVHFAEQPPRQYYRINGQNSVRLLAYPERGVNTIDLANTVREHIGRLAIQLPPSYQLRLEEDSTEYLRTELAKIRDRTLLSLGILLAFVLLAYRSRRYLLLITLSLIANLGLASILYYAFQVELHLYALAGITVSFGLIIDNTIVMAHHLRHRGDKQVFPALLAATLTTISALAIIFFLPQQWQINLLDFAKVMMINLGVSLAVAWWLIPALMDARPAGDARPASSRRTGRSSTDAIFQLYERVVRFLLYHRKKAILLVVLVFGLPVFWLPNRIEGWKLYNQTLGSDYYIENIKPVVNKVLGGTLRLFTYYVYEGSAYRQPDETILYIRGAMPPGSTLEQLNTVYRQVEYYLSQFPEEIKQYTTQVYSGQNGLTRITFNPGHDISFPYLLRSRLIAYSLNLGGVNWNIYGVGKGFSNASGSMPPRFRIKMFGYNKDELERQAERFAGLLLEHPRIQEVNTEANIDWWEKDRYEYALALDRRALARRALSPQQLTGRLAAFNRVARPDLYTPEHTPVRLVDRSLPGNDLWLLQNRQLPAGDSSRIVFARLSELEKRQAASALHKEDQQYIRMVEFEYTGSARFGSRYLNQVMELMKREMPLGYTMERITYSYGQEERKLYGLLGLVMGLIFFICAVTFESLRQALAVLLLIPVSFIGIFLTFYWFDFLFDQGGYTSFLLVSGLTVNGLILILNDYNRLRRKSEVGSRKWEDTPSDNPSQNQANPDNEPASAKATAGKAMKQWNSETVHLYIKAYRHKILPILLTILSTALGLIPFMIYGQQEVFWFSLAAGTIGGLLFSILVITLVIPLFFVR